MILLYVFIGFISLVAVVFLACTIADIRDKKAEEEFDSVVASKMTEQAIEDKRKSDLKQRITYITHEIKEAISRCESSIEFHRGMRVKKRVRRRYGDSYYYDWENVSDDLKVYTKENNHVEQHFMSKGFMVVEKDDIITISWQ